MGQATVEITIARPGIVTHELKTAAGTPHPILAAGRVIDAIAARNAELAAIEHPWVGAETYFLGEVHGGDFYNRFPTECRLVGTRRWAPGNTLEAVEAEFLALLAPIAAETGCSIELDLKLVRGAYSIDPEHPLSPSRCEPATRTSPAPSCRSRASRSSPTLRSSRARRRSRPSTTAPRAAVRTPTSSSCPSPSSCARRRVYLRMLAAPLGDERPLPTLRRSPRVVSLGAPRARQHRCRGLRPAAAPPPRRSSSRTAVRSPGRSASAS